MFGTFIYFNWFKTNDVFEEVVDLQATSQEKFFPQIPEDWKKYRNEEYGFEVRYPQDWKIVEDRADSRIELKKDESSVLIFPEGFATSLIDAVNIKESKIVISGKEVTIKSFLTEGGEWWARFIRFQEYPNSWTSDNWIWINLEIIDEKIECAVTLPLGGECGYGLGRKFFGTVEQAEQEVIDQILSTFKFIE